MTPRLFILWLHRGALTVMVAAGSAMAFCMLAGAILFFARAAHDSPAQMLADLALALALASLFSWAGGVMLLATAAWLLLESVLRAFCAKGGAS